MSEQTELHLKLLSVDSPEFVSLRLELRTLASELEIIRTSVIRKCTNCDKSFMPRHFKQTLCAMTENVRCRREQRQKYMAKKKIEDL